MIFSAFIKVAISWAIKNWKIVAIAVAIAALLAWHKVQVNNAWYAGRNALEQEQAAEAKRRNDNANAANDAAAACARDPACLLRPDRNARD